MKQISLIKQSPFSDQYMLDLYRRLHFTALRRAMYEQGLFIAHDYITDFKIYDQKLIWVTLTLLSERAQKKVPNLHRLKLDFSEKSFQRHVLIFSALTGKSLSYEFPAAQKAIKELHKQPWEDYDALDLIDIQGLQPPRVQLFKEGTEKAGQHQYVTGFRLNPDYIQQKPHNLLIFGSVLDPILMECAYSINQAFGGVIHQKKSLQSRSRSTHTNSPLH